MDEISIHTPAPETDSAEEAPTHDQIMAECVAIESEKRRWLKGLTAFLAARGDKSDPSDRVQYASDMAAIAAYEAIGRLGQSAGR